MRLLEERFAPLTYSIGFIRAPLDRVGDQLLRWRRSLASLRDVRLESISKPLDSALAMLGPLSVHVERELLVTTTSDWVAYFASFITGSDPVGVMTVLSEDLGTDAVVVQDVPDTMTKAGIGTYGAAGIQLFRNGRDVRAVQAIKDGSRWVWYEFGAPLSFELIENYAARRVRDRLNPALLAQYCRALDIDFTQPSFYRPRALLLRYRPAKGLPIIEQTLNDRRARLGLPSLGHPRA